jgi:transposase-like protein
MNSSEWPRTLVEAVRYFSDPQRCQDFLVEMRWPNGVTCPTCGSQDVGYLATRRLWKCRTKHSRQQFSIKIGSIFEDSPLGLDKWLVAMWLIVNCKNGVSSYEVHRAIHVTQQTAWFMLHRIRLAMQRGSFDKFGGEVEVDETYIGGKARFMHKDKKAEKIKGTGGMGKVAVMGLLARHDKGKGHSVVHTRIVGNVKKSTLQDHVRDVVEEGSTVYTDELKSYDGLDADYVHEVINHAETYVRDSVHTNGMENFWSLLKRSIKGTYVSVEPFHLFRYLDEQSIRFNHRKETDGERFVAIAGTAFGRRLTYKKLIGEADELPAT